MRRVLRLAPGARVHLLDGEGLACEAQVVAVTGKDVRLEILSRSLATGEPRTIWWGRPIGQEKYYEVAAAAKVKTLGELNLQFGRIDAGRDYVDIRTENIWLPRVASGG